MGHQLGEHRILGQHRVNAMCTRPLKHIPAHRPVIDPGRQRLSLSLKLSRVEQLGDDAETLRIKHLYQSRDVLSWQQRRQTVDQTLLRRRFVVARLGFGCLQSAFPCLLCAVARSSSYFRFQKKCSGQEDESSR